MSHWFCFHSWGFPHRWPEFAGRRNVDVQTCTKCGARRISTIQFGPTKPETQVPVEVKV